MTEIHSIDLRAGNGRQARRGRAAAPAAMALLACVAAPQALAQPQDFPNRPIRLVLPFAGGTDVVARLLAQRLSVTLGQQVLPDQRLGAGGNIAHETVAKAAPDGYTLLMAAPPVVLNPLLNPKVGFDPVRDFAPVAVVAAIPSVLVVHPLVPAKSLKELVALARRSPDKLSYGSGGVGSTPHLASELLRSLAGVKMLHVPYKSATIALTGAMSGEVDVVVVASSSAAPYVKNGRLRALAVLDGKRINSMPEVPTAAEVGYPQLLAVNWYAVLAPRDTPAAIVERLNVESVKAINAPETRERLAGIGGEALSTTVAQATSFIRDEMARWGKVIRDAGIKAD
ncbi:MAG: tripartite tricarboxylate transporter substrate binding protein [Burkholderiales bacterium]|nr:tripartite tricarboxylate transporter substrate binding protein [Burkholderiales bacterium]